MVNMYRSLTINYGKELVTSDRFWRVPIYIVLNSYVDNVYVYIKN